jgi:SRSO17 transposase
VALSEEESVSKERNSAGVGRWLLVRRNIEDPTEYAYYLSYGPAQTPVKELIRVAGRRWVIEECSEQAKGEAGLDHYEVRRWEAWHRHVTLCLLAHAFLEITRAPMPPPRKKEVAQNGAGGDDSAERAGGA